MKLHEETYLWSGQRFWRRGSLVVAPSAFFSFRIWGLEARLNFEVGLPDYQAYWSLWVGPLSLHLDVTWNRSGVRRINHLFSRFGAKKTRFGTIAAGAFCTPREPGIGAGFQIEPFAPIRNVMLDLNLLMLDVHASYEYREPESDSQRAERVWRALAG